MTETQFNQDQTQFGLQAPILEKPIAPTEPVSEMPVKKPLPKWAVALIVALVLVVVLIIAFVISQRPTQPSGEAMIEEETKIRELTPLEQRLDTARELLRQANPTVQELPFPPIDTTLRIDKAR